MKEMKKFYDLYERPSMHINTLTYISKIFFVKERKSSFWRFLCQRFSRKKFARPKIGEMKFDFAKTYFWKRPNWSRGQVANTSVTLLDGPGLKSL